MEAVPERMRETVRAAGSRSRLVAGSGVLLELREERAELVDLVGTESREEPAVERLDRSQHLGVLRPPCVRQLDADSPAVVRIAPAHDEPVLLEAVEVTREGRALDAERSCELVLCPPLLALEVREDEPHRHGAADFREGVVERPPDMLRRVGELKPDRCLAGVHVQSVAI